MENFPARRFQTIPNNAYLTWVDSDPYLDHYMDPYILIIFNIGTTLISTQLISTSKNKVVSCHIKNVKEIIV